MQFRHPWQRWSAMSLAPFGGAFVSGTSFYLSSWIALHGAKDADAAYLHYAFTVPFARDLFVGYALALPVLFLGRWFRVRATLVYMMLSALAVSPVALFLSTPRVSAMFASEAELLDGTTHWYSVLLYMFIAAVTGWVFSLGASFRSVAKLQISPIGKAGANDA